jgi:hypothetical protein
MLTCMLRLGLTHLAQAAARPGPPRLLAAGIGQIGPHPVSAAFLLVSLLVSRCCTECGAKGAILQYPSWTGSHVGFEPFPT